MQNFLSRVSNFVRNFTRAFGEDTSSNVEIVDSNPGGQLNVDVNESQSQLSVRRQARRQRQVRVQRQQDRQRQLRVQERQRRQRDLRVSRERTGRMYNPQRDGRLQGSTPRLQSSSPQNRPSLQAPSPEPKPPPKTERRLQTRRYDPQSGQIQTITSVEDLTDQEWQEEQARIAEQDRIAQEIESLRDDYKNEEEFHRAARERLSLEEQKMFEDLESEYQSLRGEAMYLEDQLIRAGLDMPAEQWNPRQIFSHFQDQEDVEGAIDRLEEISEHFSEGGVFEHKYESRMQAINNLGQRYRHEPAEKPWYSPDMIIESTAGKVFDATVSLIEGVQHTRHATMATLGLDTYEIHTEQAYEANQGRPPTLSDIRGDNREPFDVVDDFFTAWDYTEGQRTITRPIDQEFAWPDGRAPWQGYEDVAANVPGVEWQVDANISDFVVQEVFDILGDPITYAPGRVLRYGYRRASMTRPGMRLAAARDRTLKRALHTRVGEGFEWLMNKPGTYRNRLKQFRDQEIKRLGRQGTRGDESRLRVMLRQWNEQRRRVQRDVTRSTARRLQRDIAGMTKQETRLIQRSLRNPRRRIGDLPEARKLSQRQIERVTHVTNKWRRELDKIIERERRAGVPTPYREGYVPDPRKTATLPDDIRPQDDSVRSFTEQAPDDAWWFTKPKARNEMVSNQRFIRNLVKRHHDSLLARGQLPIQDNIRRQLSVLGVRTDQMGIHLDRLQNPQRYIAPPGDFERMRYPSSRLGRLAARPLQLMSDWRQSVTIYRPAFYKNNEISNQLLGLLQGGPRYLLAQRQGRFLQRQQTRLGITPDDISGSYTEHIGSSGVVSRLASAQENRVRTALYQVRFNEALGDWLDIYRRHGYADTQLTDLAVASAHREAYDVVKSTFFDYSTRRIEVIPRFLIPFWHWQKNIAWFTIKMPFRDPRSTSFIDRFQHELYERPKSLVPDETFEGVDPTTGDTFEYNPRDEVDGRMYNPFTGGWITSPFDPFSESSQSMWGLNPAISALLEFSTYQDHFGRLRPEENWRTRLPRSFARQVPQYQIGESIVRPPQDETPEHEQWERWLAEGSLFTKQAQGVDPSKSNYRPDLDPRHGTVYDPDAVWGLGQQITSFLGRPSSMEIDEEKHDFNLRYQSFNTEWFNTDWDEFEWDERVEKQEQLAQKYGFDLYDDIYDTFWARYDTEWTSHQKEMKQEARVFNNEFWVEYFEQPEGTRTKWVQQQRKQWSRENKMLENPYYDVFRDWMIDLDDGNRFISPTAKIRQLDFWEAYWATDSQEVRNRMMRDNPEFESEEGRFWRIYWNSGKEKQREMLRNNPQYQSEEGRFWTRYWDSDEETRRQMMRDNPQYAKLPPGAYDHEGAFAADIMKQAAEHLRNEKFREYKRSDKGRFWSRFFGIDNDRERLIYYAKNWREEYGGDGLEDPERVLFWMEYYTADTQEERIALIRANPQYSRFMDEDGNTDWDAVHEFSRKQREENIERAREELPGFAEAMDRRPWLENQVPPEFTPPEGTTPRHAVWDEFART